MDVQHVSPRPRSRSRAEELGGEVVGVAQRDADDRMAGRRRAATSASSAASGRRRHPKETKRRSLPYDSARRAARDRRGSGPPDLAGRFGQQLLEPRAEVADPRRRDQRDLVAAALRGGAEDRPSATPGFSVVGTPGPHAPSCAADRRAAARRRAPSPPPARGRSSRAPSSGPPTLFTPGGRTEAVGLRDLLHVGAGIGHARKLLGGLARRRPASPSRRRRP